MDLSLVPIDEIWEEIKKRNDACVLVMLRNRDGDSEESEVFYSGGKFTCIGLTEHIVAKLLDATCEISREEE